MKRNMTLLPNSPDLRTLSRRKEYSVYEPESTFIAHKRSSLDETCCLSLAWLNEKKVALLRGKERPDDFLVLVLALLNGL